jgi:hypothetical protein
MDVKPVSYQNLLALGIDLKHLDALEVVRVPFLAGEASSTLLSALIVDTTTLAPLGDKSTGSWSLGDSWGLGGAGLGSGRSGLRSDRLRSAGWNNSSGRTSDGGEGSGKNGCGWGTASH